MDARNLIEHARRAGRASLDEASGKRLLAHFGIAVPQSVVVQATDPLESRLAGLSPPFVVKVMSPHILHKSDVGGVRVRLQSVVEVREAIEMMRRNPTIAAHPIDGFLVEGMAPPGQELVIGGLQDPQFGPLVMVGLGGVFVEVLQDIAFRICPIERIDALEMLDELKGSALLDGVRGQRPVSREAIADVLLKIGGAEGLLVTLAADIKEADLNPVICSERAAVAVDARFILTDRSAP
jgi:acyl-CoA synthetase (NDP forming)